VNQERKPFWDWQDFLIFAALAIPCLLLGSVIVFGIFKLIPGYEPSKAMKAIPGQFLGYLFWYIALRWLLLMKYDRPFWASLNFEFPEEGVVRYFSAGLVLTVAIIVLGAILKTPQMKSPMDDLMDTTASLSLVGVSAVALAPVCEELAFRGFLQPLLQQSLGHWPAILLTALPFALMHGTQYSWNWQRLVLLVVAGSVFGYVRHRSNSTLASTATHATYNFSYFLTFILLGKEAGQL